MANEDKSARYQRLRRRASALAVTWRIVFLAALVATGAAVAVREAVFALVGPVLFLRVVVYVVVLAVAYEAIALPLTFYHGVVLEHRYGLSTEPGTRWWRNHAKVAAVSLVGLVAAALVVSGLLRWSPEWWWVGAAACFTVLLVLVVQLAPVLLLPLFYDVRPLVDQRVTQRVLALAEQAGLPVLGVFEWRLGDHTNKANAALVGLGRTRRILLSDTLLAQYSEAEIETVLAHEFAHHVYGDVWSAMATEAALIGMGFYLGDLMLSASAGTVGLDGKGDVAGLPLLLLVAGVVSLGLMPVSNALSRAHERRADRYALDMTGNVEALVRAIRRLAAQNLAEEQPSRLVRLLLHSHPSFASRIEAARSHVPRTSLPE